MFGDRGRIDVLAYHATARAVLIVEIKTRLDDTQELLGRLDVRKRIAPPIARKRAWQCARVVPAIFVLDGTTARRRFTSHKALFESFDVRARSAIAWLRRPKQRPPSGILALVSPPIADAR